MKTKAIDYKTKYEAWCKRAMLRYEQWLKGKRATKYDKIKHVNVTMNIV